MSSTDHPQLRYSRTPAPAVYPLNQSADDDQSVTTITQSTKLRLIIIIICDKVSTCSATPNELFG